MINNDGKFKILYQLYNLKYNYLLHNIILNHSFIPLKLEYNQHKCCICIEKFLQNNILSSMIVVLKCNHVFHISCFDRYIKILFLSNDKQLYIKCPLCNDCNTNTLEFFCCYKEILEKIYSEKKQTRKCTIVIRRIKSIRLLKRL